MLGVDGVKKKALIAPENDVAYRQTGERRNWSASPIAPAGLGTQFMSTGRFDSFIGST